MGVEKAWAHAGQDSRTYLAKICTFSKFLAANIALLAQMDSDVPDLV